MKCHSSQQQVLICFAIILASDAFFFFGGVYASGVFPYELADYLSHWTADAGTDVDRHEKMIEGLRASRTGWVSILGVLTGFSAVISYFGLRAARRIGEE